RVLEVFEKWDLPCSEIGKVTDDGILRFFMNGEVEAELPAHELVLGGGAPQYTREFKQPRYYEKIKALNQDNIKLPENQKDVAEFLVTLPNIASKRWIYVQYDSMVGAGTVSSNSPSDAAIVLAKPTGKALALTTDCNSRYVYADPYKGAMIAVSEAARNIVCSGGKPLGVTNCLNFGNPYDPEVYYQFVEAIKGMGEACRKFDTPVTGGNVSFYNQSPDGPVYPTPTIGMVGLLDNVEDKMGLGFVNTGDKIYLIGESKNDFNSSEYLHKFHNTEFSPAPYFDLETEFELQNRVLELIGKKLVLSAHDTSEGGLIISLLESGFINKKGFSVAAAKSDIRKDAYWFGEAQSRVVVSVSSANEDAFLSALGIHPVEFLGTVTEDKIDVDGEDWGSITDWSRKYDTAIHNILSGNKLEKAMTGLVS